MLRFIYFEYLCYINSTTLLLNIFCIKSESELFLNIRDEIKRKKKFNFPKSYVAWNIGFEQQGQSINLIEPISNFDSSLTCRLSKFWQLNIKATVYFHKVIISTMWLQYAGYWSFWSWLWQEIGWIQSSHQTAVSNIA